MTWFTQGVKMLQADSDSDEEDLEEVRDQLFSAMQDEASNDSDQDSNDSDQDSNDSDEVNTVNQLNLDVF